MLEDSIHKERGKPTIFAGVMPMWTSDHLRIFKHTINFVDIGVLSWRQDDPKHRKDKLIIEFFDQPLTCHSKVI